MSVGEGGQLVNHAVAAVLQCRTMMDTPASRGLTLGMELSGISFSAFHLLEGVSSFSLEGCIVGITPFLPLRNEGLLRVRLRSLRCGQSDTDGLQSKSVTTIAVSTREKATSSLGEEILVEARMSLLGRVGLRRTAAIISSTSSLV